MSQPAVPSNLYGAVDLSALANPAPSASGEIGVIMDVTDQTFQSIVEISMQVPVIIDLWATWCEPCKQLSPVLESLATEYDGRFLLAKIDVDASPQVAAAFQVQSVPSVVALIGGRPLPLFQGAVPADQVRQVIDEVLRVAGEAGVKGTVPSQDDAEPPAEPEVPPLHQEAYDAIERGDFDAAMAAYRKALAEDPRDDLAEAGLKQVELLTRTASADVDAAVAAADADPTSIPAALLASDVDVLSGQVERALTRLVRLLPTVFGDERETVRQRLVDLFVIVGADDPAVVAARRAMATALF